MRRKTLAFAFAFVFGCALAAVSLSPAARAADGQPVPDMDERVLWERYHIPPTKEGLLTALHHSDASVRTFAAARLAARGEKDVAPAILAALRAEALPGARTLIAVAAVKLGAEEEGLAALGKLCHDPSGSGLARIGAAQAMLSLGHEECLGDVLDVLRLPANTQDTLGALYALAPFKHVSAADLPEFRRLVGKSLAAADPVVRTVASYALHEIGDYWAFEQLRAALSSERDEQVRQAITAYLEHPQER